MKPLKPFFFLLIMLPMWGFSQKGTNKLQPALQIAIPVGKLADIVKTGYGGSVKGIYGITRLPQSITLEGGINRFAVKNVPSGTSVNYTAIPVYAGYRANLGGVILEAQGGVSVNRIEGFGPIGTASETQAALGWAISAAYEFRSVELGLRFQSSEADDDTFIIRSIGIRLGYNFKL